MIWEVVRMQQQIRQVNVKQRKIKKPLKSIPTLPKVFVDNDPMEKLLKFMAEGNKKLRKHEMEMMKSMFAQLHPFSAMPFHYHSPSSNGNSSRFQQIPYHQNHVTAEGKGHPENMNSFYNMLQTPLS